MGLYLRYNGNNLYYTGGTTKMNGTELIKTPYALCYNAGTSTSYIPLVQQGTTIGTGSIIKSGGVYYRVGTNNRIGILKIRVNGVTYDALNYASLSAKSYAIPAGTYTPRVFRNMILSFIARGSGTTRAVDRATSVTVNNQTVSLSSGALIRYQYQGTSPFNLDFVTFGRILGTNEYWKPHLSSTGFTTYKAYCVDGGTEGEGHGFYAYYSDYSITVNTSFNFS